MFKNHIQFIFVFIVLAFSIQIHNLFFAPQKRQITLPSLKDPMMLNPSETSTFKSLAQVKSETTTTTTTPPPSKVVQIKLPKLYIKSPLAITKNTNVSSKNPFVNSYKKFAKLVFNKGQNTQYELDFNELKENFLSLGLTVDKGKIKSPNVTVKYTDGSSETLKLPFDEMFKNDWVKLETNPDLAIQSILVSAASPSSKSIFSFFVQQNL